MYFTLTYLILTIVTYFTEKENREKPSNLPKGDGKSQRKFELRWSSLDSCSQLLHYAAQDNAKGVQIYSKKIFKKSNKPQDRGHVEIKPKS